MKIQHIYKLKFFLFFISLVQNHCSIFNAKAEIIINSISPAENSKVNKLSTMTFDLNYQIDNYNSGKNYTLQVWLYDTNTNASYGVYSVSISGTKGNVTNSFSGKKFYNCYTLFNIETCARKTALPFKLWFTISEDDKQIGETSKYVYDELLI